MKPIVLAFLIVLLMSSCSMLSPRSSLSEAQLIHSLDEYVQGIEAQGFSGLIAIYVGDRRLYLRTHGYADREAQRLIDENTVFHLGSVSKSWTAAAILSLVNEEKLSLDDSLRELLPSAVVAEIDESHSSIDIHQLLTHSAGLEDFPVPCSQAEAGHLGRDEFLQHALQVPLKYPSGHQFAYSNAGYDILAAIVEIIENQPFEQVLKTRFFEPLGLTETGTDPGLWSSERIAVGYDQHGKRWGRLHELFWGDHGALWCNRGSGALLSTADELRQWVSALMHNQVVSDALWQHITTSYVDEGTGAYYGYGWSVYETQRFVEIGHTGSLNHILEADVRVYPQTDVIVMVLGNSGEFPATEVLEPILPQVRRWLSGR
ncbi:beta-lactamase family protein [Aliidiomarina halalkaliphila]|uniref:Beta-lactamase family protein n=1 Tax=Aliidiomarina halalkaliphila TaxID=2593535 RepID=A0A552X1S7_9GAMM|nr:serine hydrolase domain-containing protein [Aliidiomarina halalkaliphila]TRW48974.1 beta-lactamase family protein [Aliidiomarina halalkaliphila]